MYHCQICKQYARKSLKEIIRHIRDMHRYFSTPVRCGVEGCPSTATSYDTLRQHTYKKHRSELIPEDHSNSGTGFEHEARTVESAESVASTVDDGSHSHNVVVASSIIYPATTQSTLEATKFILKLMIRDGKGLPQTVTNDILKDIQAVIDSCTDNLKKKVVQHMKGVNKLSDSEITQIQEIFSSEESIFDRLESVHKQELYFEEHFDYVV